MSANDKNLCPECAEGSGAQESLDRRNFFRWVGGGAMSLAAGAAGAPRLLADAPTQGLTQGAVQAAAPRAPRPAEALIRELHQGLSDEQKRAVVYPWDHGGGGNRLPVRLRMMNQAYGQQVSQVYTRPQQELIQRIVRAICSDDEGFRRIATVVEHDNWGGRSWQGAGANIFGNPADRHFAWVFTAHHLTLRCDGSADRESAFGGPMYYGHIVDGTSQRNVFNYQTRWVRNVFEALNDSQRGQALLTGSPGEQYQSVRFRASGQAMPGLPAAELSGDQRRLVEAVMREVLSPFRHEDADEVMDIVRRNGGLERIHLAFYRDRPGGDNTRWDFWRLEGPGFVWNYRVRPHVHCYVNVGVNRG